MPLRGRTLTVRHALHAWHEREEVYTGIQLGKLCGGERMAQPPFSPPQRSLQLDMEGLVSRRLVGDPQIRSRAHRREMIATGLMGNFPASPAKAIRLRPASAIARTGKYTSSDPWYPGSMLPATAISPARSPRVPHVSAQPVALSLLTPQPPARLSPSVHSPSASPRSASARMAREEGSAAPAAAPAASSVDPEAVQAHPGVDVQSLLHKVKVANEENLLLRHEIKELRRNIDLLNDRAPTSDHALEQVNKALKAIGVRPQPPARTTLSDAWAGVKPEDSARESIARDGAHSLPWDDGPPRSSETGVDVPPRPRSPPVNRRPSEPPSMDGIDGIFARVICPSAAQPHVDSLLKTTLCQTIDKATTADVDVSHELREHLGGASTETAHSRAVSEVQGWSLNDALGSLGADVSGMVANILLERLQKAIRAAEEPSDEEDEEGDEARDSLRPDRPPRRAPRPVDRRGVELTFAQALRAVAAAGSPSAPRATAGKGAPPSDQQSEGVSLAELVGTLLREAPLVDMLSSHIAKHIAALPLPLLPPSDDTPHQTAPRPSRRLASARRRPAAEPAGGSSPVRPASAQPTSTSPTATEGATPTIFGYELDPEPADKYLIHPPSTAATPEPPVLSDRFLAPPPFEPLPKMQLRLTMCAREAATAPLQTRISLVSRCARCLILTQAASCTVLLCSLMFSYVLLCSLASPDLRRPPTDFRRPRPISADLHR